MSILKNTGHSGELYFENIADQLKQLISDADISLHLFSPYITTAGISALLGNIDTRLEIKVYTTWKPQDISWGSSDPKIYPLVKSLEGEVFLIKNLHLKGALIDFRSFLLMTSNITENGLSLDACGNAECATYLANILPTNLIDFHKLIGRAIPVSEKLYEEAISIETELRNVNRKNDLCPISQDSDFLVSKLPCTQTPEELITSLNDLRSGKLDLNDAEIVNVCHDVALYQLELNKQADENVAILRKAFLNQPFIASFTKSLMEGPRYFGETKAWIQSNCSDDPTPHRRKLTDRIQNLFRWFPNLYPEQYQVTRPNYSEKLEYLGKM